MSQSQWGRPPSQAGYASSPWWALPRQLANAPQTHPLAAPCRAFHRRGCPSPARPVSASVSRGCPGPGGQVVYVLLTRSPLRSDSKLSSLRPTCMCIRHAASVHPEPGSNSPSDLSLLLSARKLLAPFSSFFEIDVCCSVFKDLAPSRVPIYTTISYSPCQLFFSFFYSFFSYHLFFLPFFAPFSFFLAASSLYPQPFLLVLFLPFEACTTLLLFKYDISLPTRLILNNNA